jgi:rhodanese-related sulfurtransferase
MNPIPDEASTPCAYLKPTPGGAEFWAGLFALTLSISCPLQAMTVEVVGDTVFASGPVDDDYAKLRDAFDKPGVTTVAFVNSPGGDLGTSLRVGRLIADRNLKTVAAGSCMSACSIMFLGGVERRFSDVFRPNQNVIGIHGAHDSVTKTVNSLLQPQMFAYYKQRMGERFNSDVMNLALYKMEDRGAFLRVPEFARNDKAQAYHCAATQTARKSCTNIIGENALSLGIITDTTLVTLKLPKSMEVPPIAMAQNLDVRVDNSEDWIKDLEGLWCRTEQCKNSLGIWSKRPENRALASRSEGVGIGFSSNRDSLQNAVLGAIYQCNHIKGLPVGLCEAQVVNNFDLRPLYLRAVETHQQALEALNLPSEKTYANEEFGGNFTSAKGYRTQKLNDITPLTLEGVKTIVTQDLAKLIKSVTPPRILEVSGVAREVIPLTQSIAFGGNALEDTALDASFNERFSALLALMAPDKNAPLVLYCFGRNTWFSVNAALRAKNAGYTNIYWYRGGLESWTAGRLPTALPQIRAAAL